MSPPTPSAPILSTPQLHISNNLSSRGYFRNCIGCFKHAYCLTFSDACKDHAYCRYCFNHFVRLSCGGPSNDEEKEGIDRGRVPASASTRTFPPRCCGQPTSLPDDALRLVLEADVLHLYMLKRARSRLPLRERTHCAAPDCGMWLTAEEAIREDDEGGIWMGWKSGGGGEEQQQQQQQQDQGVASRELRKCSRCAERTCTACKQLGRGHLDGDGRWKECPVDEEAVRLESMADGMKWTRCGGCGVWVELSVGCRHVV
ncbi:hypothetical protein DIS24_g7115 [Lasiodiplodia hormozganensis]|uniref:IBR domain-containing protein n=1 Tax=Lasiodiplodia hormozganensis TaxID=869390 RepID=A0AA39YCS1_9PEZI|nr:hypothetical protein DIS24_g7115 [Lasiodiplodia hormozganensis]